RLPRAEEVPPSLAPLLRRNAASIRRDPDFHDDVERLATALRASVNTGILDLSKIGGASVSAPKASGKSGGGPLPLIAGLIGVAALIAVALVALHVLPNPLETPQQIAASETDTTLDAAPETQAPAQNTTTASTTTQRAAATPATTTPSTTTPR